MIGPGEGDGGPLDVVGGRGSDPPPVPVVGVVGVPDPGDWVPGEGEPDPVAPRVEAGPRVGSAGSVGPAGVVGFGSVTDDAVGSAVPPVVFRLGPDDERRIPDAPAE